MLTDYIQAAMHKAHYELIDDGTFVATIPSFQGIWANAETLEACRDELRSVLEDWILVSLTQRLTLPVVDGLDLNLDPSPAEVA
jgi:predicted RNase H-like HicB family nuclease